jgi:hypothetical protein
VQDLGSPLSFQSADLPRQVQFGLKLFFEGKSAVNIGWEAVSPGWVCWPGLMELPFWLQPAMALGNCEAEQRSNKLAEYEV